MKVTKLLPAIMLLPLSSPVAWAEDPALKTQEQKFAYAVGQQVGQQFVRQDLSIDQSAFDLGFKDALSKHEPRMTQDEFKAAFEWQRAETMKRREAMAKKNLDAGKTFLDENKKKPGVKELPNGLQYKIITEGKGKMPKVSDTVTVHYVGKLINGTEFDSSRKRGEPVTFQLGNVIKGWQELLPLMQEGAKWEAYIPANLAYGERGSAGTIGPNETLIFEIELISIAPTADKPQAGEDATGGAEEAKPAAGEKPATEKTELPAAKSSDKKSSESSKH